MTEPQLSDVLDRAVADKPVGPPRIDAIRSGAARIRRRRTVGVMAAVTVIVAVAGGTAFLVQGERSPQPPVAADPPVGPTRMVGIGHAAVAVPADWGRNVVECGTPVKDTVVIDLHAIRLCLRPRPKEVESIELASGKPRMFAFRSDEVVEISGVRAERQRTTCAPGVLNGAEICSGAVYFPTLDVAIRATSSTDAATVDRMLGWITVVADQVGVPEPRFEDPAQPAVRSAAKYVEQLKALGLRPVIETKKAAGHLPGDILDIAPAPGTLLMPGATVTIVVAGP